MDLATIIGLIAGAAAVLSAVVLAGEPLGTMINPPSFIVVLGGTIGATFITFSLQDIMKVGAIVKNAFFSQSLSATDASQQIFELSNQARREGLLSLENSLDTVDDEFLRRGLQFAIDGTDPQVLRNILETELIYVEERHNMGQDLFNMMNKYAPAFGMIGTLIGLVVMLKNMSDPTAIGPAMAVALVTTLYGAIFANLIFGPIAAKLKNRSQEEALYRQLIVEGLILIVLGEQPRMVQENLNAFLAPKVRQAIADTAAD